MFRMKNNLRMAAPIIQNDGCACDPLIKGFTPCFFFCYFCHLTFFIQCLHPLQLILELEAMLTNLTSKDLKLKSKLWYFSSPFSSLVAVPHCRFTLSWLSLAVGFLFYIYLFSLCRCLCSTNNNTNDIEYRLLL